MKTVDKGALVLIVLAVISGISRPLVQRLSRMAPDLWPLPEYQIAMGVVTAIVSMSLGIGIGIWLVQQARRDGRSVWVWFLFGLVFNLIAVLVYLLLPIYEERVGRTPVASRDSGG